MRTGAKNSATTANRDQTVASLRVRLLRAAREKDGSMALETAFVLPIFFLILFGIFEFSMLLTGYCSATYAVRIASRYASVHSANSVAPASTSTIQSMVQANLFMPGTSTSYFTTDYTTYNASQAGNYPGNIVNVSIAWNQSISLPGYHSTITLGTQAHRVILH